MDFGFSEDQEMLRQSARDFLSKECPMTLVRKMMDDESGHSPELWKKMAELGWQGLILPEEFGGAGLTFVDLIVVLEEMGRVVLPGPFLSTVVFAGLAIAESGTADQKKKFLPRIATGDLVATLALIEPSGRWDADGIAATATPDGDGWKLEGTKLFVPDGHVAELLVVAARKPGSKGNDGVSLFLVDAKTPGLRVSPLKTMDQTRKLSEVVLSGVKVGRDALLGAEGGAWKAIQRIADRGKVALCAEMCGGAQRVLDMSVEYAKVREQFGKPIGSFQAIQHKCADMVTDVDGSRFITYKAAWSIASGQPAGDTQMAVNMAKAWTSEATRRVVAHGQQIHGGIGFTKDYKIQLFYRRQKRAELAFGDADHHRELVAQQLGI